MNMDGKSIAPAWCEIDLGELATFRTGPFGSTFHKSDYVVGGTPLINPSHIIDGDIVPDEAVTVRPELAKRLEAFALREGEIVIGRRGDMGRCAVVKRCHEGFLCGTGSMIVRPRPGTNPHLLQSLLSSPEVIAKIEENSVGTTMINLNQETLSSLVIRMAADPNEQQTIADALSDADALIEGLERLIGKKRLIKQGAMKDFLTAKRRLPGFSEEWGQADFGSVIRNVLPKSPRPASFATSSGDHPFFLSGAKEAKSSVADYDCCGAIIFSCGGSFRARNASGKFSMSSDCLGVETYGDARFFASWMEMNADTLDAETFYGSGLRHLDKGRLRDVAVPRPSDAEQSAIADVLHDMETEVAALGSRLEKAKAIKKGMMQALLTGRIRLDPKSSSEQFLEAAE